jgi:ribonuclease P protein component
LFGRLKKNYEFQNVYRAGVSKSNNYFVMYVLERESGANRYGFSVSKRVGNSVVRHRITRLLRETIRKNDPALKPGRDIIIAARPSVKGKCLKDIENAVLHLCKIHGVRK